MKDFKCGDVIEDEFGRKGVVIGDSIHRRDTMLLLVKYVEGYGTLEVLKRNDYIVLKHYDDFEDILNDIDVE